MHGAKDGAFYQKQRSASDKLYYIEMFDFEHSVDEDRYIALGKVGDVLFVVFTERKDTIRLISARLATNAERSLYYDQDICY